LGGADFPSDRVVAVAGDKITFAVGAVDLALPNT